MLKYLDGGPILNLVFLVIAILGILIAIYHGRKNKKLVFNIRTSNLVWSYENVIPHLTISYKDAAIPNLTLAKVAIWNAGNDVVDADDIPELDKVRITLNKPFEFLETVINYVSKPSNKFSIAVSSDKTEIMVDFDFIDEKDGITLNLYHTGNVCDLAIKGAIKGVGVLEDYSFISQYNVGALVGKLMQVKIGGRKRTFSGILIRILFFPI